MGYSPEFQLQFTVFAKRKLKFFMLINSSVLSQHWHVTWMIVINYYKLIMILIVSFLNLVTTLSQLIAYRNYFLNTFRLKWLEKETKILLKVTKQRF